LKKLLLYAAIASAVLGVVGVCEYWGYGKIVEWRISDLNEATQIPKGQTPDANLIRKRLHKVLSWPIYGSHDAYLITGAFGDKITVPLLIEDLKHEGDIDPKANP
jgi:hypothetical protein